MPSLNHYRYLAAVVLDRAISSSSSSSSSTLPSTSKMKIGKAPELLKKAATIVRSKASTVRARLLIVASLRRRMAMIGAISHRIHALIVEKEKARVDYYHKNKNHDGNKALVMRKVVVHDEMVIADDHDRHLSELAMFDQEDHHGYSTDHWTHSLFNDDDTCYSDDQDDCGDDDGDDDEPSVIDIIRSNREDEGLEFNIDDEIDQAADMFIRRIRSRMSRSV
ncbi:uncharacterized protein [Oryza sativa Japonica Group]|jgi:hypothetical protein|uniref:Os09g0511300 protein n=1 Tax=Oryza sativa subsp. japonica TaxID=39947 RepID=A0A0P0XQ16_ORYSJ|nr:uncharacterized protein LOC107277610 [Oryza sativa Japonica Group]KAB8111277.1 hypothetical protein EE612_048876 [Oryza sativa]KAF2917004.1 hypothetical protein DAI22_09g160900 [Oryza sativa Japonica Group]BAT08910.1 Os09g0511300 [Oryza sativa Japonica Group]